MDGESPVSIRSLESWRRVGAGSLIEEPGISGRDLGVGGQSINGRFWEAVGGVSGQGNGQQEGTDQ